MKYFKLSAALITLTLTLVLGAIATLAALLATPPWNDRNLQQLHGWVREHTGYEFQYLDNYTGPLRSWDDEGRLRLQYQMVAGHYHGTWIAYDEQGRITRRCTYRHGEPWDGLCQIYERKPWLAEYRAGQLWRGSDSVKDTEPGKWRPRYVWDGVEVSKEEYGRLRASLVPARR
jgi:hypothetical protein